MKEKLSKTGKKKDTRFMKRALIFSISLTSTSLATFIPLIMHNNSESVELAQNINDTEKTIENMVKNNHLTLVLE